MESILRPLMRALDRFKIILNAKKPTRSHAPYTRDMGHIMSESFLEDPEFFYFRHVPADTKGGRFSPTC